MPAVDMAYLRPVTPAEAAALNDVTEVDGIDPLDTYAGIAATLGGMNEQGAPGAFPGFGRPWRVGPK